MELYKWYILISVFLIIMEIFAAGFILLPIGIAGLVTATVAYFRPELWLHAVFFICGSGLALLAVARFRDENTTQNSQESGGHGLVGQVGTIVSLPAEDHAMKVKIFGDVWDVLDGSLPTDALSAYSIGTQVRVTKVTGNKIAIERI